MKKNKRILSKIMATVMLVTSLSIGLGTKEVKAEENIPKNNYDIVENMGLGFNIGKTFSQEVSSNKNIDSIKKRIDAAYEEGFTTVRIPVKWTSHIDNNGCVLQDDTVNMIKDVVDYAYEKDMYIILGSMGDVGEDSSSYWDLSDVNTESFKTKYTNMWNDIAEMFNDYDYHLVFEAYNEPKNFKGNVTTAPDGSAYNFGYKDAASQAADSYYFAGRCGNIYYMQTLNATFAEIMKNVAPEKYYMISSYNADPRSAFTDYSSIMWGSNGKVSSFDYNLNGGWGTCYLHFKGIDTSKAIYNCHIYSYGDNFESTISTLKSTFNKRNINLPIYVNENGTHTNNFESITVDSDKAAYYAKPISVMKNINSGLCLWDDTQSMSYLDVKTYEWYNQNLMDLFINTAGQKKPIKVPEVVNITVNTVSNGETQSETFEVPYGISVKDAIELYNLDLDLNMFNIKDGSMIYSYTESSTYKDIVHTITIDVTPDTIFNEDTVINLNYNTEQVNYAFVHVCSGEQGECSKNNDVILKTRIKAGSSAKEVIDLVYSKLGDNLPYKEGYIFQGFYQEGTRPYFLYQNSNRTANGYIVLYAKFDKN